MAVVCAIHQPRSSIWNIFDDILLLGPGGHVVYHGARDEALKYFASVGYKCPPKTNTAEVLIDLVSLDLDSSKASMDRVESLALAFRERVSLSKGIIAIPKIGLPLVSAKPLLLTTPTKRADPFPLWTAPNRSVFRFLMLLKRALRQTLRDNATNLTRIAVSSLLAALLGTMYGKGGQSTGSLNSEAVADKVSLIAHSAINVSMLSMVKALQLFKRERAVVDRERALGRYSAGEYLWSKLFAELPVDAIVGAVSYRSEYTAIHFMEYWCLK